MPQALKLLKLKRLLASTYSRDESNAGLNRCKSAIDQERAEELQRVAEFLAQQAPLTNEAESPGQAPCRTREFG